MLFKGAPSNSPPYSLIERADHTFRSYSNEELICSRVLKISDSEKNLDLSKFYLLRRDSFKIENEKEITDPLISEQYEHLKSILKTKKNGAQLLQFINPLSDKEISQVIAKLIFLLDHDAFTSTTSIDSDYKNETNKIIKNIEDKFNEIKIYQIPPPELKLRILLSREIASTLITSKGMVNMGIIPTIREILNYFEKGESGYKDHFETILNILERNVNVRNKIQRILPPVNLLYDVQTTIRVSLALKEDETIENYHISRALLKSLFSYPRQESVANCFALSLAISLFQSSPDKCLDDFIEIIKTGGMSRKVDNMPVFFPLLLKQPRDLALIHLPPLFEKCPVFIHLKNELNLNEWPQADTVDDLMKKVKKIIGKEQAQKARFIIESTTKDPLIGIWSNILASMAEGGENTLLKNALVGSLLHIAEPLTTDKEILTDLKSEILKRVHIHYDPEIEAEGVMNGGFVLYDKKRKMKRIDNPKRFHHFVLHSIRNPELRNAFKDTQLIINLLEVYHPENKLNGALLNQAKKFPYTPWIAKIGNDPKQILKVYKGSRTIESTQFFHPSSAKDLLEMVLQIGNEIYHKNRDVSFLKRILIPVRIVGEHSFNFLINHPSLLRWIIEPAGLENALLNPAMLINQAPYDSRRLLMYVKNKYNVSIKKAPSLLKDLRYELAKHIPTGTADRLLFQFLPTPEKKSLMKVAIHFADTNWEENGYDLQLAFGFNPSSLQFEIFEIYDEDIEIRPTNQDLYIKNALWEFYKNPGQFV